MTAKPTIYGWHFLHEGHKMRDETTAPKDGQWLTVENPEICVRGLHGSRTPGQALNYAPGPILCLCAFSIPAEEHPNDKFVSASRRIIARFDATEILRYYARMQALSVIHLWNAPDVALDYLMTGNEAIRDAVWAAARAAAGDDAGASARAAARAAAGDAAGASARASARDAAWDAARAAAWASAWASARGAAWDAAARAATWASAWDAAARDEFDSLVYECFEGPLAKIGWKP